MAKVTFALTIMNEDIIMITGSRLNIISKNPHNVTQRNSQRLLKSLEYQQSGLMNHISMWFYALKNQKKSMKKDTPDANK